MSDEDVGPWTFALPLGVYGIGGDQSGGSESGSGSAVAPLAAHQVPLYDSPDDDTVVVGGLVSGRLSHQAGKKANGKFWYGFYVR